MAIGNPITLTDNVASKQITIVATADQTSFAPSGGYRINQLGVYRNGVRLVDGRDFTARDGATVTLVEGASASDVVEFQIFDDFKVADAINANDSEQTINGNLNVVGIVSATTLTGDGAQITGVSTGVWINAAGGALQRVVLANTTVGVASTMANTGSLYWNDNTSTLYATNVNVSGTMTQEDVQNVDSTGIVTAGLGFRATKGGLVITAGVSTFTPYPAIDANEEVQVGASIQLGKAGIVTALGLDISTGGVDIDGLTNLDETIVAGVATFSAAADFNGAIDVDGQTDLDELVVAGVATFSAAIDAYSIDLDGQADLDELVVAGVSTFSAAIDAYSIDVDGQADLDEVVVAGVATFSAAIDINKGADLVGGLTADNVNVTGIATASKFSGPGNVPAGQTGTVTLAASDAGKHVAATGTVTLGTGIFAVGDAVTIYNNSAGGITITLSAVTCYNAADGTTGNRTLGARGLATILCTATNTYVISGAGLT